METHKVVPLLKGTDRDSLNQRSYRPVALLPVLSKVLEKAVFSQLVTYMEENGLIHPNLLGSRPGHRTATAISEMYDNWLSHMEKGKMVLAFLLVTKVLPLIRQIFSCWRPGSN